MKSNITSEHTQKAEIIDFDECITFLNEKGKSIFGDAFVVDSADYEIIFKVLVYTIRDVHNAQRLNIDLSKGLLLSGPVGCGKTSLMKLINLVYPPKERYLIKSCREVSYDFISNGYSALNNYSHLSYVYREGQKVPRTWCFDDLGTENTLKYFGNDCNVMVEVLLSRYDLFIENGMKTHLTTNLTAKEIEDIYGNRVRSRLREMFNLISFDMSSRDKRS
jgi:energy-coupling factor transporter ATP-binding protein EcfA2